MDLSATMSRRTPALAPRATMTPPASGSRNSAMNMKWRAASMAAAAWPSAAKASVAGRRPGLAERAAGRLLDPGLLNPADPSDSILSVSSRRGWWVARPVHRPRHRGGKRACSVADPAPDRNRAGRRTFPRPASSEHPGRADDATGRMLICRGS